MVIGTPVLNRTNFLAKSVFGMFISTQPFKQFIDDIKATLFVIGFMLFTAAGVGALLFAFYPLLSALAEAGL